MPSYDSFEGKRMGAHRERMMRDKASKSSDLLLLHEAQLGEIAERRKKEGTAHPFFWASFVLLGDPN